MRQIKLLAVVGRFIGGDLQLTLWEAGQLHRRTLRPGQHLLARLELHLLRRMQLDIPAFQFHESAFRRRQQMPLGARVQAGVGAGDGDFLVGGGGEFAALGLGAYFAAGGVEVDAGFLVGFVRVFCFAVGEE